MSDNNFFKTNRDLLVLTALTVLVLGVYWQTTGFGFINLDDNLYVYDNPAVIGGLSWEGVKWAFSAFFSANWHPLTWLSHMLDAQLFGRNAGGHHAVNIVLHLINSVLAFTVFRKMTGCFWKSAAVAALFAVHPAHVESVAWISERKDVLSTLFWLLTMWAYLRYAEVQRLESQVPSPKSQVSSSEVQVPGSKSQDPGRDEIETDSIANESENRLGTWDLGLGTKFYALTVVLFALGLMAKPMLVTLPFVLLLMDFWSLERLKGLRDLPSLLLEKAPLFVLSAVSAFITILAQRSAGAVEALEFLPLGTRILNALLAYAKYVVMLFYPAKLAVWYPYEREFPAWQIGGALVLLAAVTALCVWQMRQRKYLLTGWLWFLGTLVPVIGIVQVGSQSMADRYTYIPYFGLFIMLAWGLGDLLKSKRAFYAVLAGAVIVCSILSFRQTALWRDNETLYRHTLAVTKDNFLISHNLCFTLTLEDRTSEAEPLCRRAVELNPNFYEGYNTLGILQLKRGQAAEAEANFRKVLEIAPRFTLAYANLAVAESLQKKPEDAEASLEKAVRFNDGKVSNQIWIDALNNLARAYSEQGKHEKAAENLTRILLIDQANAPARANLALTFNRLKRYDEAQKLIESAIQLSPTEPAVYNIYGTMMLEQNRNPEAAAFFEKALQLKPDYAEAKENLKKAKGEK